MSVAINLTPSTIQDADYPIAQTPALGGEKIVYLSTKASRLLGVCFLTADDTIEYKFVNEPSAVQGPILAVAIDGGILADAAPTITLAGAGGLTATFDNAGWSSQQTRWDFPVGRAVEFTGTTFP